MKYNSKNIEMRATWCERAICNMHRLSTVNYTNLMYETGCQFVENLFPDEGIREENCRGFVNHYITSQVYWYYWIIEWVNTCEVYLDWNYSQKTLDNLVEMQMQTKRPWTLLHDKIIKEKQGKEKAESL